MVGSDLYYLIFVIFILSAEDLMNPKQMDSVNSLFYVKPQHTPMCQLKDLLAFYICHSNLMFIFFLLIFYTKNRQTVMIHPVLSLCS